MHLPERFSEDPADYVVQRAPQPTLPGLRCERIKWTTAPDGTEVAHQCCDEALFEQRIGPGSRLLCEECGIWIASGTPGSGVRVLVQEPC